MSYLERNHVSGKSAGVLYLCSLRSDKDAIDAIDHFVPLSPFSFRTIDHPLRRWSRRKIDKKECDKLQRQQRISFHSLLLLQLKCKLLSFFIICSSFLLPLKLWCKENNLEGIALMIGYQAKKRVTETVHSIIIVSLFPLFRCKSEQ